MSSLIELKPNEDFVSDSFVGYKLAFDSVPVYRHKLENGVDQLRPSDDQYSFLHVKVFGFHNHLYADPWSEDDVYYIDKQWKIQRSVKKEDTGMLSGVVQVWEMPSSRVRRPGHYNTSLQFASPELAVLADGAGTLHLVSTGFRDIAAKWKLLFSEEVCGEERPFVAVGARVNVNSKTKEVHVLLLWIDDVRNCTDGNKPLTSYTRLEWIVLSPGETQEWSLQCVRQVSGAGGLDYAAFEPGCQSLYISSEKVFAFSSDSTNPIETMETEAETKGIRQPDYLWLQTAEDITVHFQLDESVERSSLHVRVDENCIKVECKGIVLLQGSPWHLLEPDLTTWTLDRGRLEIVLVKVEEGLIWQELVKGDTRGEQVLDPALVEQVHQRLAHLCSDTQVKEAGGNCPPAFNLQQLEDCDVAPSEPSLLVRLDALTHEISHRANLGGLQWLFNVSLKADSAPCICLRHGNDGYVWQPEPPQDNSSWPYTHVGSFPAFGYVQASKTRKKFCPCAPDLSYVAVCETSRHIFIYRRPFFLSSDLRNRRTGERVMHIAKQQIVNLESDAEVMGVHAACSTLYVLTSETLYALRIIHVYGSES